MRLLASKFSMKLDLSGFLAEIRRDDGVQPFFFIHIHQYNLIDKHESGQFWNNSKECSEVYSYQTRNSKSFPHFPLYLFDIP